MNKNLPIGLFDSGVGGLSVLKKLRELLPQEDYIYLGDTARTPYGPKGPKVITQYSRECLSFLQQQKVKLIVVACNTASSAALPELSAECPIPVIGMIEPASKAASLKAQKKIAVIGTRATILSNAYQSALRDITSDIEILVQACPLFVPLVEEGIFTGPLVQGAIDNYLSKIHQASPDTLILACTHYPFLRPELERYFGLNISIIDCGEVAAEAVRSTLNSMQGLREASSKGKVHYYVTDDAGRFKEIGKVFLGENEMDVSVVQNLI